MRLLEVEKMIYSHACLICQRRSLPPRTFVALFGVGNATLGKCWKLINDNDTRVNDYIQPQHLLWAMMFLKQYSTEDVLSATVGVTPQNIG